MNEALRLLRELSECVTALEHRAIRSSGEFHVWAEERMVTDARDAADRFLAAPPSASPALDGVTAELVGVEAALDDAMKRLHRTTDTLARLAEPDA